jgi:hypothetical protein
MFYYRPDYIDTLNTTAIVTVQIAYRSTFPLHSLDRLDVQLYSYSVRGIHQLSRYHHG